ncbi:SGNH/GDSL hydrolase family protein [Aquincola tertiaricarbonis]|uniref:SGNH/GDSL hydrolase family protein n=1 Tax=Aquincola tertiaricarbonis TaxID=391953 RepID=A0ABY4SIN3_AQUTE|nr:SGNH/GDSL hydrolase family protein [Aquincola tertiaricarbonis]URI10851.1 SGNH/GDSL hydrolase family protein [Aquincola tertiaricarbonis]
MKHRNSVKRVLAAALLVMVSSAQAGFSGVYLFGDSLTDTGNDGVVLTQIQQAGIPVATTTDPAWVTSNAYVSTRPFDQGSFTNGVAWAVPFAQALGVNLMPSLLGGTNYAYGGAETGRDGTDLCPVLCDFPYSLKSQVGQYLKPGTSADPNALYVVAGGGNNARNTIGAIAAASTPAERLGQINALAEAYAKNVGDIVDTLQAAGAQHIVVWDTPNIGLTPSVASFGADAQTLGLAMTGAMNSALAERLGGEAGVTTFSVFSLLNQVAADPTAYGLSNATDACAALGTACDPTQYLFWDGVHPTATGHELLADAMLAHVAAIPEPSTYALMLGGLAAVGWFARRKAR